jgi:hypothetical protein
MVWGFALNDIEEKHALVLQGIYEQMLDNLADCAKSSKFQSFHAFLKEVCNSEKLSFLTDLPKSNASYAHVDYVRKHLYVESFALVGDFEGLLNAQRTLDHLHGRNVAAHYGLYRRLVPNIVATGREIYYCASKSWLIATKEKQLKEQVLRKFGDAVKKAAQREKKCFLFDFANRHQIAISKSLDEAGFGALDFKCLLRHDKKILTKLSKAFPSAYSRHVKSVDLDWLANYFPDEKSAREALDADVKHWKIAMLRGRLFLEFQPNYGLFYEIRNRPGLKEITENGPEDLYPESCKGITYLPFGKIATLAGGVYKAAAVCAATNWLEEFSSKWKPTK